MNRTLASLLAALLFLLPVLAEAGMRVRVVRGPAPPPEKPGAPLEGPLVRLALTATDESSSDELNWNATAHAGVDGNPFPGATTDTVFALLDSGAATHLVSYEDAQALGITGDALGEFQLAVGGIGGTVDVDIALPLGLFVHGFQDLTPAGELVAANTFGQGNFAPGVNTLANQQAGSDIPSVLGSPLLAYFGIIISNSQRQVIWDDTNRLSSASVSLFFDPADTNIPTFSHRVFIEARPTASPPTVSFVPEIDLGGGGIGDPQTPSVIFGATGAGSLYFTSSSVAWEDNGFSSSGRMMFDTGAQATLISEIAAAELGLSLLNPDFEVDVQGVAGVATAPGFYLDQVQISALGGPLVWTNVPTVVLNAASPEGGTLYGILGMNLFGNRDFVINSLADPAYLDVTDPVIEPDIHITSMQCISNNTWEIGWLAEPAPPQVTVQRATDLSQSMPMWSSIATAELAVIQETITVTGAVDDAFFRISCE